MCGMAIYRAVCRHVRYWRGNPHRWSTVYHFQGTPSSALASTDAQAVLTQDNKMCYGPAGSGGTYECDIYAQATGGVPLVSYRAFDPAVPAGWPGYLGTGWSSTSGAMEAAAETALQVEWPAGISSSGKPVLLRKWYHAVPLSQSTNGAGVDITSAIAASLQTQAQAMVSVLSSKGLVLSSGTGRLAGTARVLQVYGNHQMPRGRRRKAAHVSTSDFSRILQIVNDGGGADTP